MSCDLYVKHGREAAELGNEIVGDSAVVGDERVSKIQVYCWAFRSEM
jgi:hypothetical protein